MITLEHLEVSAEAQREVALRLCEASHQLAREANGNRCRVIPAPVVYDMLGELKVALGHLLEVVRFLPQGIQNSLEMPQLSVYDCDPWTGQERDPSVQVGIAAEHLHEVLNYLTAAVDAAEDAQTALNSQGYREVRS